MPKCLSEEDGFGVLKGLDGSEGVGVTGLAYEDCSGEKLLSCWTPEQTNANGGK